MIDHQPRPDVEAADETAPEPDRRVGPVARFDEDHNVLWMGDTPLPFRPGTGRDEKLLELLGVTIRALRGLDDAEPCLLRRSEYRVVADLLDLDDPELRRHLRRHLGLTRRQAGDTAMQLRRTVEENIVLADA